jgi:hypothetical protein
MIRFELGVNSDNPKLLFNLAATCNAIHIAREDADDIPDITRYLASTFPQKSFVCEVVISPTTYCGWIVDKGVDNALLNVAIDLTGSKNIYFFNHIASYRSPYTWYILLGMSTQGSVQV